MQEKEKQQMTEEELQRTQVLNFDDFKQAARYEKISSKKPAVVVALIGILAILVGAGYPVVQSQLSKKVDNDKDVIQARKKDKVIKSELTCTSTTPAGTNGLDKTLTIKYEFNNEKLTGFTKTLDLKVTPGSAIGPKTLQDFIIAFEPYLIKKSGYEVSVQKLDNEVITTTEVDYDTIDINGIPDVNQSNSNFNVQYVVNTSKESIKQDMEKQEYTCK